MRDGGGSFYARHGPIFAWLNLLATLALLVLPVVSRAVRDRARADAAA